MATSLGFTLTQAIWANEGDEEKSAEISGSDRSPDYTTTPFGRDVRNLIKARKRRSDEKYKFSTRVTPKNRLLSRRQWEIHFPPGRKLLTKNKTQKWNTRAHFIRAMLLQARCRCVCVLTVRAQHDLGVVCGSPPLFFVEAEQEHKKLGPQS